MVSVVAAQGGGGGHGGGGHSGGSSSSGSGTFSGSNGTGAETGAIIGVVAGVVVVCCGCSWLRARCRRRRAHGATNEADWLNGEAIEPDEYLDATLRCTIFRGHYF